jgi:hypothetical protein
MMNAKNRNVKKEKKICIFKKNDYNAKKRQPQKKREKDDRGNLRHKKQQRYLKRNDL